MSLTLVIVEHITGMDVSNVLSLVVILSIQLYHQLTHRVNHHSTIISSDLSMERGDGFQGPIIVSDPENEEEKALEEMYDGEEVVFLQDWYHLDGQNRRTGEFIVSLIIVFSAYNQIASQYLNHSILLSQVLTAFLSSGLVMPKLFSSMVVESTLLA